jgi:mono/diheme cytochrome c family protein
MTDWTLRVGLILVLAAPVAAAGDAPSGATADDARAILARRCGGCHGPADRKGGLRLDRREEALAGGDSGPALAPGRPDESLLLEKVVEPDPDLRMPPEGPALTAAEIDRVRAWIAAGAPWGEAEPAGETAAAVHWAFRAPVRPEPPPVRRAEWPRGPIDRFVLARLEREGVAPAPEADRVTLIRRLSLDLLGLPPGADAVSAFVRDRRPDAYERLVDRLLASPHFGERWGRHWLDLARYADSDGYEKDSARPFAYRYRDWVIDAINADVPFDRFSVAQLAGDLLPGATLAQRAATGFHRNTLTNREGGVDREEFRVAAVIDRVNTTGTVWLGLTVGCAQCHTHKYDPLTHREYYGLYAFFDGADEVDLPDAPPGQPKAIVAALADRPGGRATRVLTKGDFLRPGDAVRPGTPAALPALSVSNPTRLNFAEWLFAPENPLAARVEANRVWSHLFGRGLVATPDDFGTRGEPPSHPELLDWLAVEFRESGWGRKALVRRIVTSAAYRQDARARPEVAGRDPYNAWLSRQARFRPEAEVVRDLALAASGLLATRVGGPSVRPPQPAGISELTYAGSAKWQESAGPDRHRRGMYTWFQRTSPYPMLLTFDAPDANVCAARRERSNTPLQALTLLNDPVFVDCARALGRRVVDEAGAGDDATRVATAFRLALGRAPDPGEAAALLGQLGRTRAYYEARPDAARALAGDGPAPDAPAVAAAWTAVARTLLNLDEFLTRP